ncbi:hypothetical protein [Mameliella alba]|uniref:Uncharacterized protein n=1 Tax=Mameliella alba TaxID=561184 RepID=A0A0B3SPL2_9RHOB|nr:hypothetical protein [Mameliella alba]KHQ52369.1 hypothetical protein OA50_03388 [Mameliella alba]
MSGDLKERLRELDQKYRSVGIILCDDFKEAADRIEALEAQLAEARADGMREAAGMFHEEQVQIWSQEILEGLAMADLFSPSTYDDKIDAARIVQKELTDIAATILSAIEKGEG